MPADLLGKPGIGPSLSLEPFMERHGERVLIAHNNVNGPLDSEVRLAHIQSVKRMAQMTNEEFAEECRQRRTDYDTMFVPRATPEWLARFEAQVLEECRADLSYLNDPEWSRIFEMRVSVMNAEREREAEQS